MIQAMSSVPNALPRFTITPTILNQVIEIHALLSQYPALSNGLSDLQKQEHNFASLLFSLKLEGFEVDAAKLKLISLKLLAAHSLKQPLSTSSVSSIVNTTLDEVHHLAVRTMIYILNLNLNQLYLVKEIQNCHHCLFGTLSNQGGVFRNVGVGIYHQDVWAHMAPAPQHIPTQLRELLLWLKTTQTSGLLSAFVFHFEFIYLFPFKQGNQLIARLWQQLLLNQFHPVFSFLDLNKPLLDDPEGYELALTQSDANNNAAFFVEYMLKLTIEKIKNVINNLDNTDQVKTQETDHAIAMIGQATDHVMTQKNQLTDHVKRLLKLFLASQNDAYITNANLMALLHLKHRPTFKENYLGPALRLKLIEMTYPDVPKSPKQSYKLTELGLMVLNEINNS